MSKKLIVVVGAGPGVGNSVAKKIGVNNFQVVLIFRKQDAFGQYIKEFSSEGIETFAVAVDATSHASLTQLLIKSRKTTVESMCFTSIPETKKRNERNLLLER